MGTPYTPSINAGNREVYIVSGTSEQHESHFQGLATLSTQPGPSPKYCTHCCCCNRGHDDQSLTAALKHLVSELVEQALDQYGLRHLRQTTEQTSTLVDDQQQVLHQHQQQQALANYKEHQALNKHKQQQVHKERKEQQVLIDHKQQHVHNKHQQQLVLHERKEEQVHNKHPQQLVLCEPEEEKVLKEPQEQQVHNDHPQQLVLHERKEQRVHNKHSQQLVLHERKEQQVHNEQPQQLVLHERKVQQVHNEHPQQLVLQEPEEEKVLSEPQEQKVHNEPPQQLVLHERKEQKVHSNQAQQLVLKKPQAQKVHSKHPQQLVLHERKEQQVRNEHQLLQDDQESQRNRRQGQYGRYFWTDMKDLISETPRMNTEKVQSRGTHSGKWEMEKVELMKKVTDAETSNHGLRRELEQARDAESQLRAQLQESNSVVKILDSTITQYKSRTTEYETRIAEYKAIAANLTEQLSNSKLSISKHVGGAGADKDSYAASQNLKKCREVVNQGVATFTEAFTAFLKERNAYESHVAVRSVSNKQDEAWRKDAVHAYICSRLFAGFENDCYMDGLDSDRSSKYLPAEYEETQFFLQNQDLDLRYKQYVAEYERVKDLGVDALMNTLKNLDTFKKLVEDANAPFFQFCCRKLVSIMNDVDKFAEEFPPSGDYSQHFLLHQLATNSAFCDTFLKSFVNLAMAAFLLHRLAFQFHPPARIFRYASGTPFDATHMVHAALIDDRESDKDFVVGVMLLPGFQVGATIIKSTVYRVPKQQCSELL